MSAKSAQVVIGANFGDEGKGLVTDYFAAQMQGDGLVVRYNGGAQAGHTVVTPDGLRHVYSHMGSGTSAGVATFLSAFFVCNPILFLREQRVLQQAGLTPRVLVDPASPVTTPYDMLINQIAEASRGNARHGSCGVGFGETLERDQHEAFRLRVADLAGRTQLADKLRRIRDAYLPQRLAQLRLHAVPSREAEIIASASLLENYCDDAEAFLNSIQIHDSTCLRHASHIVFEGAQGLLLDQARGYFPHVTRSHTGLRNVLQLAAEAGITHLDTTYVTRAYLTRHGAGPLPGETAGPPYADIVDPTNVPNAFQGSLRFGWLDVDLLARSIAVDLADAACSSVAVTPALAMTCLDQIGDTARFVMDGCLHDDVAESLPARVAGRLAMAQWYASHGPDRRAVRCLK